MGTYANSTPGVIEPSLISKLYYLFGSDDWSPPDKTVLEQLPSPAAMVNLDAVSCDMILELLAEEAVAPDSTGARSRLLNSPRLDETLTAYGYTAFSNAVAPVDGRSLKAGPGWYGRLRGTLGEHLDLRIALKERTAWAGRVLGGGDVLAISRTLAEPAGRVFFDLKNYIPSVDAITKIAAADDIGGNVHLLENSLYQISASYFTLSTDRVGERQLASLCRSIAKLLWEAGQGASAYQDKVTFKGIANDLWFLSTVRLLGVLDGTTEAINHGVAAAAVCRILAEVPVASRKELAARLTAIPGTGSYSGSQPHPGGDLAAFISQFSRSSGVEDTGAPHEDPPRSPVAVVGSFGTSSGVEAEELRQARALALFALDGQFARIAGPSTPHAPGFRDDVVSTLTSVGVALKATVAHKSSGLKPIGEASRGAAAEGITAEIAAQARTFSNSFLLIPEFRADLLAGLGEPLHGADVPALDIDATVAHDIAREIANAGSVTRSLLLYGSLPRGYRTRLRTQTGDHVEDSGFRELRDVVAADIASILSPGGVIVAADIMQAFESIDEVNTWKSKAVPGVVVDGSNAVLWAEAGSTTLYVNQLIELQALRCLIAAATEDDEDRRFARILKAISDTPSSLRSSLLGHSLYQHSYTVLTSRGWLYWIPSISPPIQSSSANLPLDFDLLDKLALRPLDRDFGYSPYQQTRVENPFFELDSDVIYPETWGALVTLRHAHENGTMLISGGGLTETFDLDFQGLMRACAALDEAEAHGSSIGPEFSAWDFSVGTDSGASSTINSKSAARAVHHNLVGLIESSWLGFEVTQQLLDTLYGVPTASSSLTAPEALYMFSRYRRMEALRGSMSATFTDHFYSAGPNLDEALARFKVVQERFLQHAGAVIGSSAQRAHLFYSFSQIRPRTIDYVAARRAVADGAVQASIAIVSTAAIAASGGAATPLVALAVAGGAGVAAVGTRLALEGPAEVTLAEGAWDFASGAFEGALEVATGGLLHGVGGWTLRGATKVIPAGEASGKVARGLVEAGFPSLRSMGSTAKNTIELGAKNVAEGMLEGFVGAVGGATFETVFDRETYRQGLAYAMSAWWRRAVWMGAIGLGGGSVGALAGTLIQGFARAAGRSTPTSADYYDAWAAALAAERSGMSHVLWRASGEQHTAMARALKEGDRAEAERLLKAGAFGPADVTAILNNIFDELEKPGANFHRALSELGNIRDLFVSIADEDLADPLKAVEFRASAGLTGTFAAVGSGGLGGGIARIDAKAVLRINPAGSGGTLADPKFEVVVDSASSSTVLREEFLHCLDAKYGDSTKWHLLTEGSLGAWGSKTLQEKAACWEAYAEMEVRNANNVMDLYGPRPLHELTEGQRASLADAAARRAEYQELLDDFADPTSKTNAEVSAAMANQGIDVDTWPRLNGRAPPYVGLVPHQAVFQAKLEAFRRNPGRFLPELNGVTIGPYRKADGSTNGTGTVAVALVPNVGEVYGLNSTLSRFWDGRRVAIFADMQRSGWRPGGNRGQAQSLTHAEFMVLDRVNTLLGETGAPWPSPFVIYSDRPTCGFCDTGNGILNQYRYHLGAPDLVLQDLTGDPPIVLNLVPDNAP